MLSGCTGQPGTFTIGRPAFERQFQPVIARAGRQDEEGEPETLPRGQPCDPGVVEVGADVAVIRADQRPADEMRA